MSILDQIAEREIQAAEERGELNDLPGAGQPLVLDDDSMIPESLRAGYRLLKNAGYVPPELELQREIRDVSQLLRAASEAEDREQRERASRRLSVLWARLEASGRPRDARAAEREYRNLLLERFDGAGDDAGPACG